MPTSSSRKKKPSNNSSEARRVRQARLVSYIDDFMDEVVASLPDNEFGLVSVIQESAPGVPVDDSSKHYYVISRSVTGKLLEHNEGPEFIKQFVKSVSKAATTHTKIIVGYFERNQVDVVGDGINFKTPYVALQWVAGKDSFIPDNSFYNWNGCLAQAGGEVPRNF